jgi:hypothetical protein
MVEMVPCDKIIITSFYLKFSFIKNTTFLFFCFKIEQNNSHGEEILFCES